MGDRRRQQGERMVVKYVADGKEIPASQVSEKAKEDMVVRLFCAAIEVAHPGWSVVVKAVSETTRAADRGT